MRVVLHCTALLFRLVLYFVFFSSTKNVCACCLIFNNTDTLIENVVECAEDSKHKMETF